MLNRHALSLTLIRQDDGYHIYNVGKDEGYIIVADKQGEAQVVGYADEGCLTNSLPDGLNDWLYSYRLMLSNLAVHSSSCLQRSPVEFHAPILPLIQTNWDQGYPFNRFCPSGCFTGCVATSMAQIMYYYHWPDSYSWDVMLTNYTGSESTVQLQSVAQLMLDCGQSVNMSYSNTSSEANSCLIPGALINKFGYHNETIVVSNTSYSAQGWDETIYHELSEGRPVILNAMTSGNNGHSFICDGYDGNGFYHVNWGWGGIANGYYRLMDMTPSEMGAGGNTKSYDGYSMNMRAVIGIQPANNQPTNNKRNLLTVMSMGINNGNRFDRPTSDDNFSNIHLTFEIGNFMTTSFNPYLGFALVDDDYNIIQMIWTANGGESTPGGVYGRGQYLNTGFGKGIKEGSYRIVALCHEAGDTQWSLDKAARKYYIEAIFSEKELLLIPHPQSELSISRIEYQNGQCVNTLQTVKAYIQNTGEDFNGNLYMLVNGNYVSGIGAAVDGNSQSEVFFRYRPRSAGYDNVVISLKANGEHPVYEGSYRIETYPWNSVYSIELKKSDANMYTIDGMKQSGLPKRGGKKGIYIDVNRKKVIE